MLSLHLSGAYGDETGARPIGSTVERNGKPHTILAVEPHRNRVRVQPVAGGRPAWATVHQCGCFLTGEATYLIGGAR
jgi:hypothetical protein